MSSLPHTASTATTSDTGPAAPIGGVAAATRIPRTRRRVLIFVLAAVAVAFVAGGAFVYLGDDNDGVGPDPVDVSTQELRSFADSQPKAVYWAASTPGYKLELTRTKRGNVYVRYLPDNVAIGDRRALYTAIGSYPMRNAFSVVQKSAKEEGMTRANVPGGGIAALTEGGSRSVYLAYPGSDVLVEVYAAKPEDAERLALSGRVGPVR